MRTCAVCGFHNPDARERCVKCSAVLVVRPDAEGQTVAPRKEDRTKVPYGLVAAGRKVRAIGRRLFAPRPVPDGLPRRHPWSAAYLAIFFGAGAYYNHQFKKAAIFAAVHAVMLAAILYTFFMRINDAFVLALVLWIFYAMADGYSIAVRINGDEWRWRNVLAVWFSVMFYLGAFFFLGQLGSFGLFYVPTMKSDNMAPVFERGDKLFVLSWPLENLLLGQGSVVYYDPKMFAIVRPGAMDSDEYTVRERSTFGVITALPGQTMSQVDRGWLMVDGERAAPNLLPIDPNGTPPNFDLKIPKDHVGVLFSHAVSYEGIFGLGGGAVMNPRDSGDSGMIVQKYDQAVLVPDGKVRGVAVFCFYPPQRRRWFGATGGVHDSYPSDYPENTGK